MGAVPDSPAPADVAVVGLWHLGSVSAAGWLNAERRVVAWDDDASMRRAIAAGRAAVVEPGVDEVIARALDHGDLIVADDAAAAVSAAPLTQLAYDTHLDRENRVDDPRLDAAVSAFASHAPDAALLLVSSQVPVGTSARFKRLLDEENRGLLLAHVPENLRLGRALEDFLSPARLIVGADDDDAFDRAQQALSFLPTVPTRVRLASAEMTKHATNAYLALCIAFANDIAWLARAAGADPNEVIDGLRADPRVAPTAPLRPGTAFSGATLIRDLTALRSLGESAGRAELFDAVIRTNERHSQVAVEWLRDALGTVRGKRVAALGLTYKAGTSTLRDSLPLRVIDRLASEGAAISAWDPHAEALPADVAAVTRAETLSACVEGAHAVVVLTAFPELQRVDWTALAPATRVVVDTCGVVDRAGAEAAGWRYFGLVGA